MGDYFRLRLALLVGGVTAASNLHAQDAGAFGGLVTGDFNGDGRRDTCQIISQPTRSNSAEFFSSLKGKKPPGSWNGEVLLLNEGDLDGDGADELTVIAAPDHGCTYDVATFQYKNGQWSILVPLFLWQLFCEPFGYEEAQARIYREEGHIFRLEWDPNEENQDEAWHPVKVR